MNNKHSAVYFFYIFLVLLVGCGEKSKPAISDVRPSYSVAAPTRDLWKAGDTISVAFLNGTEENINIVVDAFATWERFANIHFTINKTPTDKAIKAAYIKVNFSDEKNAGTHSVVGKGCRNYVGSNKPTMQFQFKDTFKSKLGKRKAALHEIGHALGLLHEHTNTNFPYNFKKEFLDTLGTTNQLNYVPTNGQQNFSYDDQSIMLYSFNESQIEFKDKLITTTPSVDMGDKLSYLDVESISKIYPGKFTNTDELKKEYQKYYEETNSTIEREKKLNYCQIYSPGETSKDSVLSTSYFSFMQRTKDLSNFTSSPDINFFNGELLYSTTKLEWALEQMETSDKCRFSDSKEYISFLNQENARRHENNKTEKCIIKFDSSDDLTYKNLFCIYDIESESPIEARNCYYSFNDAYETMIQHSKCLSIITESTLDK